MTRTQPVNRLLDPMPEALAYEHIAENLTNAIDAGRMRHIAVMGIAPRVGASTVAVYLAETLAQSNPSVLVLHVEAGAARTDALARALQNPPREGVTELHLSTDDVPRLTSAEESEFKKLLQSLEQAYSVIIWDLPPADKAIQSRMIGQHTQGMVLVAEAGKTRWQSANYAIEHLRFSGCTLLGVILNKKKAYIPNCVYRLFFRHI